MEGTTESSASGENRKDRENRENRENGENGEDREDSFFVDKEAEQEEVAKEIILSKLTRRVTEHMRKQKENIVKRANFKVLKYNIQEIITLQIPKQYRFGTEMARIPVRVLEKTPKVYSL